MRPTLACLLLLGAAARAQNYGEPVRFKVDTTAGERKCGLFLPSGAKKNEVLPLVVALPGDADARAFVELGPWEQPAYDKRFAVLSVDLVTATRNGWHPSEQAEMNQDMDAVTAAVRQSLELAKERGIEIDDSAVVLTGWSGASYPTMWLGVRRPGLFLGVCMRSPLWHADTVKFSEHDKIAIDPDLRIYIYRGENDQTRSRKEGDAAVKDLQAAGFRQVRLEVVAEMGHEMKIEPFLAWFGNLLKETAKSRKERRAVAADLARLRAEIEGGKGAQAYGKLVKLAQKEEKLGVRGGARAYLAEIEGSATKKLEEANSLAGAEQFDEALALFKEIEGAYAGLDVVKEARASKARMLQGGPYKAAELLARAKELLDKDLRDKACELLEEIAEKYPESGSAAEARALLKG